MGCCARSDHRCTRKLLHFTRFLHFMLLASMISIFLYQNLTYSSCVSVGKKYFKISTDLFVC